MLYIHQSSCLSPQQSLDAPRGPEENLLRVPEPRYEGIPANTLRRMSKSVRLGIGASLPLLERTPAGILIGTGYGGMEDSIRFLNQIVGFDEGLLTPGTFVQSTANAIASQLGLLQHNNGYNITFVGRGVAFESALLDAAMLVTEQPGVSWLVGGIDEISAHNYRFEVAEGWYKREDWTDRNLYEAGSPGTIAGEGAAVFLVNGEPQGALAGIREIVTVTGTDEPVLQSAIDGLLRRHFPEGQGPDWLISGENGDSRALHWYRLAESALDPGAGIARFKHLSGEYPTASAYALWLACNLPGYLAANAPGDLPGNLPANLPGNLPPHLVKRPSDAVPRHILIYNNYKFNQHSLILLEKFP